MITVDVTHLPRIQVSDLTQLQWTVDAAKQKYYELKDFTQIAWKMHSDAIDDDDKEAIRDCRELALHCEENEKSAWHEWDEAKRVLLAHYS